jgi:hypothetical protein
MTAQTTELCCITRCHHHRHRPRILHEPQQNFSPRDFRAAAGIVGQHTIVMGVVYVITLGIAMVGARLATI